MKITENNYAEISKEINKLNQEQETLIEKEIEIIKKYNISGIVANVPNKDVDFVIESLNYNLVQLNNLCLRILLLLE
jgi:hypothetical protein